jgi:hypothetical protein
MLVWDCGVQCTYKHTRQSPAIRFFMIRPVDLGPPLKVKHQIPLLFSFCSSFFEAVDSFLQQEDSQGKSWRGNLHRDKGRALCIAFYFSVRRASDRRALHTRTQQDRLPRLQVRPKTLFAQPRFIPFLIFWHRYMISKLGFSPGEAAKGNFSVSFLPLGSAFYFISINWVKMLGISNLVTYFDITGCTFYFLCDFRFRIFC